MTKQKVKTPKHIFMTGSAFVAVAFLLILGFFFYKTHATEAERERLKSELDKGVRVHTAIAHRSKGERILHIPGDARSYATATIFGKLSGYLKEMRVDKGDVVKEGDILAIIDSPETTMNYIGALADAKNKRMVANRMQPLQKKKLVSDQEAEQAYSVAEIAEARVESLKALRGYETITAPFAGTITARYADPGALVQEATSSQTSALALVTLSRIDRLRVYVYLDQKSATFVKIGDLSEITVPENPDVKIAAPVSRVSGELDVRTRTMLVEIDIDNSKGMVVPNSFVEVSLKLTTPPMIQIPLEAVVPREDKSFVPVLLENSTVKYTEVVLGDTDGLKCDVRSGLAEGEKVILNLGNNVVDGQKVQVVSENEDKHP